jgi:hypothetical protein
MKPVKLYSWEQNAILKEGSTHISLVLCKKDIKPYCKDIQNFRGGYFMIIVE